MNGDCCDGQRVFGGDNHSLECQEDIKDEPINDTNADSMADWGADRADLGGVR